MKFGGTTQVAKEIAERDSRDRSRPDAVYLDSSRLSVEEVELAILKLIREKTSNGKEIH